MTELRRLKWFEATSVEQAINAMDKYKKAGVAARLMAGGTDLIGAMKDNLEDHRFDVLVHIKNIPNLNYLKEEDGGLKIGALATISDIETDPLVRKNYPTLAIAASEVASPQIRNMGTIGGNINQRPRCWYYRSENFNCYKKGGDFCFAVTGENTYHAIVAGELCYIVHPSDTAPALIALDAKARIVGPGGEKVVPFDQYFTGPRVDVLRETILGPSDILVEVQIPKAKPNTKGVYLKVKERGVWDFATVAVATVITLREGLVEDARIVLGGTAPTPLRVTKAEEVLKGKKVDEALARAAAEQALLGARPMSNNAYKVDMAKAIVRRAILASV